MEPRDNQGEPSFDLAQLERHVREDLDRERGLLAWLRCRSRAERWLLLLAVATVIAGLTFWIAPRPDFAAYPRARMLLLLAWFVVAAGAAAWLALRPIYLPRPERGSVLAILVFATLGPLVTALLPELPSAHLSAHRMWPWAYACFASGTVASLLVLLAARALHRGGSSSVAQVALASVAAGLVGATALQLHCPINYPLHLVLGHATVPLGLMLATWVVRRIA